MSRRGAFDVSALEYRFAPATDARPAVGRSERYTAAERPTPTGHRVSAHLGGEELGFIEWHPHSAMVNMVKTNPDHRGKGIATALWQAAHVMATRHGVVAPKHSDVQMPDGARWANGMTAKSGPKPLPKKRVSRQPVEGQGELF